MSPPAAASLSWWGRLGIKGLIAILWRGDRELAEAAG
jgi:hypothetical protein